MAPHIPLTSLLLLSLLTLTTSSFTLIFKGCSTSKFPTPSYSYPLQTLLSSLAAQSPGAKFYNTSSGVGNSAFFGLFQCRNDLSPSACSDCVDKVTKLAPKLCRDSVASHIQLSGCYLRYEVYGFPQASGTDFLYKVCGSGKTTGSGPLLKSALGEVVKGVGNGTGFYTGNYESVYVLGQCEGDLGNSDCVDCVKKAVDRAESDCGDSSSGQVYLQRCYISYNYYTNVTLGSSGGKGRNTQRTIAIVVGSVAGFGLLITALMFLKSAFKKRDTKY